MKKKKTKRDHWIAYKVKGNTYLSIEAKSNSKRLEKLMEAVSKGKFALMTKEQTPIIAILPITEFLRLKTIENYLKDEALMAMIEQRLESPKGKSFVQYDVFLERLYAKRDAMRVEKKEAKQCVD